MTDRDTSPARSDADADSVSSDSGSSASSEPAESPESMETTETTETSVHGSDGIDAVDPADPSSSVPLDTEDWWVREPIEPEDPGAENALFVVLGVVGTVLLLVSAVAPGLI